MSDVLTRATETTDAKLGFKDRRRAGRIENATPELIALMRKPSADAIEDVALYDAAGIAQSAADDHMTTIKFGQVAYCLGAVGICAAGWFFALQALAALWS
ncbi:MAG: hypothetical protein ACRYGM_02275 [Janthinobacterium lividum]